MSSFSFLMREPPPFFLQSGTMVGFMIFLMRDNIHSVVVASRRLQGLESVESTDDVQQAIMVEASNVSVLFSAIFFFLYGVHIVAGSLHADLHIVQRSVLKKRVEYSMYICLYVCFFSCLFNGMQFGPQDDIVLEHIDARDDVILDIGRPIEWILTCPLMQLVLPIIGGENVPDFRRWSMPLNAFVVLCFGLTASLQTNLEFKLGFYFCGVTCFCVMLWQMNRTIVESTQGEENLFMGKSIVRVLTVIVALTWIPFPIWYALSPEGFNIITNAAAMKIAVAFLNVFSKGAFMFYLSRVRADLEVREQAMNQVKMTNEGKDMEAADGPIDSLTLNGNTAAIIHEVLSSMGRSEDFPVVKEILEKHMITSSDDVMVLTAPYCQQINLPWGFVSSVKQKIRAQKVEMQDVWTLKPDNSNGGLTKPPNHNVSVSRPASESGMSGPMSPTGRDAPLPPQIASDPRKLREHARRELSKQGRDPDEFDAMIGLLPRADLEKAQLQAMLDKSQEVLAREIRELRMESTERTKQTAAMERKVQEDLQNAHEVVGGMMEKVMDVLERRLQQHVERNETRRTLLGEDP